MWETTNASPVTAFAFVLPIQQGPVYDANGNQKNLTATGESIAWIALNQPISMNGVAATYDALGRMVETGRLAHPGNRTCQPNHPRGYPAVEQGGKPQTSAPSLY